MTGPWTLAQLDNAPRTGLRVVSTFSGGGGSSMGYRLAGCDVVAAVEIDPTMADCYEQNLGVGKVVRAPVGEVAEWDGARLLERFGVVDILDGSPPCSTFSMAGSREDKWGTEHRFREGQAVQRLDSLFLEFVGLAGRIRPRVIVGENVKGMLMGNARGFVLESARAFAAAGYDAQLFLLDASRMGVPQRRERVVFVARRRDLELEPLKLTFEEPWITVEEALQDLPAPMPLDREFDTTAATADLWVRTRPGRTFKEAHSLGHRWNWSRLAPDRPAPTLAATPASTPFHWATPRRLNYRECARVQTFPDDYDFKGLQGNYVCGMSVPPQMMRRIALAITAWLGEAKTK